MNETTYRGYLQDNEAYRSHMSGAVPYPTAINIELTTRCNLRCIMCPKTAGQPRTAPDRTMTREVFERILEEVVPRVFRVDVVGDGEVLLAPDLLQELLARCKQLGIQVNICTNGLLLHRKNAVMLVEQGLADMNISLDAATAETFKEIRGGDWERLLLNLKTLNEIKREQLTSLPRLHFTMVGMVRNIQEFPAMVRLAAELGGSSVTLQAMGEFEAVRNQSVFMREPALGKRFYQEGKRLGAELGIAVGLWPESQFEVAVAEAGASGSQSPEAAGLRKDCYFPWDVPYFTTAGEVLPCCAMTPMGSLAERSFDGIWQGVEYARLRQEIYSMKPPGRCITCPGRGWFRPTAPLSAVELGGEDRQVGLGWYQPERDAGGAGFRWTRDAAALFLANPNAGGGAGMLIVELAREPHESAVGSGVIIVDEQPPVRFSLAGTAWHPIALEVAPTRRQLLKVEIKPDSTWRPSDVLAGNPDVRLLGVKVHSARLIAVQSAATFDGRLQFLGLETAQTGARELAMTYRWRCLASPPADYEVFVHFIHESVGTRYDSLIGKLKRRLGRYRRCFFQHDHRLLNAGRPTSAWLPGEILSEAYRFSVPANIVPGRYQVLLGLWQPGAGSTRIPVSQTAAPVHHRAVHIATISIS